MKRLTLLAALAAFIPSIASAMPVGEADMLTGQSVTDRFIAGELDTRLAELGTNHANSEFMPIWHWTQITGTRRHCTRTLHSRGKSNSKCSVSLVFPQ